MATKVETNSELPIFVELETVDESEPETDIVYEYQSHILLMNQS